MNHQPMSKRLDGVSSTATAKANSAQAKADANEDDISNLASVYSTISQFNIPKAMWTVWEPLTTALTAQQKMATPRWDLHTPTGRCCSLNREINTKLDWNFSRRKYTVSFPAIRISRYQQTTAHIQCTCSFTTDTDTDCTTVWASSCLLYTSDAADE